MMKTVSISTMIIAMIILWSSTCNASYTALLTWKMAAADSQEETITLRVYADGDKTLYSVQESNDPQTKPGSRLLITEGGQKWSTVSENSNECVYFSADSLARVVRGMIKTAERWADFEVADSSLKKVLEEPGPVISGFSTIHLRFEAIFVFKAGFLFSKYRYKIEREIDIWIAPGLPRGLVGREMIKLARLIDHEATDKIFSVETKIDHMATIKVVIRTKITNIDGEITSRYFEALLSKLERVNSDSFPPGMFALPKCRMLSQGELKDDVGAFLDY